MKTNVIPLKNVSIFILYALIFGCSPTKQSEENVEKNDNPPVVRISTQNMEILMPDTLIAGLNHLVYENKSNMTHFLLFNKVPGIVP